jgi:hypothetical protein
MKLPVLAAYCAVQVLRRSCLQRVLAANQEPLYCTLRTRKRCAVLNSAGDLLRVHHILNECVIDRWGRCGGGHCKPQARP